MPIHLVVFRALIRVAPFVVDLGFSVVGVPDRRAFLPSHGDPEVAGY
jgi:hypothetical protein